MQNIISASLLALSASAEFKTLGIWEGEDFLWKYWKQYGPSTDSI